MLEVCFAAHARTGVGLMLIYGVWLSFRINSDIGLDSPSHTDLTNIYMLGGGGGGQKKKLLVVKTRRGGKKKKNQLNFLGWV